MTRINPVDGHAVRVGRLVLSSLFLTLIALPAAASLEVSFGVQGGQPATETMGPTTVRPADAVDVETTAISFGLLPAAEDLDAYHVTGDGRVLFSTTTGVNLEGVNYGGGDVIEYDPSESPGSQFSALLSTTLGIDGVSMLPGGNLLVSTVLGGNLLGSGPYANGDVIEVDLGAGTAGVFSGLSESVLFTGANADVDALHYDDDQGSVLVSLRVDGNGTVGGYTYNGTGVSADLVEIDLSAPIGSSGSLFFDGDGLYNGNTRQLDAAFLVHECSDGLDNDGDGATDLDDLGCDGLPDLSERSLAYACDDGHDNDGDGAKDFPADPGCAVAASALEAPACSDGLHNDGDGLMDFDGGAWVHGVAQTAPDPQCVGLPWRHNEKKGGCGSGYQAALILPLAWTLARRRRGARRSE